MDPKIKQAVDILSRIVEDTSIPRNIRKAAENAKNILLDEKQPLDSRIGSVLYILEEISNDRNLPMHARTLIWNISSILESLKE